TRVRAGVAALARQLGGEEAVDVLELAPERLAREATGWAERGVEARQVVAERRAERDPVLVLRETLHQQVDVGDVALERDERLQRVGLARDDGRHERVASAVDADQRG